MHFLDLLFPYVQRGACKSGWINANAAKTTMEDCGQHCYTKQAGYFAFCSGEHGTCPGSEYCACYSRAQKCGETTTYQTHLSYEIPLRSL